jgi:hypothetical protein
MIEHKDDGMMTQFEMLGRGLLTLKR